MAENIPDVRLDRHVRLLTGPYGTVAYTARTVGDAAEVLLQKWPKKSPRGPAHIAAQEACIAVLGRLKEARHAREAFEAAGRRGQPAPAAGSPTSVDPGGHRPYAMAETKAEAEA